MPVPPKNIFKLVLIISNEIEQSYVQYTECIIEYVF